MGGERAGACGQCPESRARRTCVLSSEVYAAGKPQLHLLVVSILDIVYDCHL